MAWQIKNRGERKEKGKKKERKNKAS